MISTGPKNLYKTKECCYLVHTYFSLGVARFCNSHSALGAHCHTIFLPRLVSLSINADGQEQIKTVEVTRPDMEMGLHTTFPKVPCTVSPHCQFSPITLCSLARLTMQLYHPSALRRTLRLHMLEVDWTDPYSFVAAKCQQLNLRGLLRARKLGNLGK